MPSEPSHDDSAHSPPVDPNAIPTVSEKMSAIATAFEKHGVMGLVRVDAGVLSEIEVRHGDEARRRCLKALIDRVLEVAEERLEPEDVVCTGEPGHHEVLVFLFRSAGCASLVRTEMPGFISKLGRLIDSVAPRIFYPFRRQVPPMWMGQASSIRNPQFGVETELRRLIQAAREDCDLERRLHERAGRREFIDLILDQRVHSVYEPIVEVSSRTVFGYESLIRGEEGTPLRSPLALFSAAEEHDMIFELDCVCRSAGLRGAVDFPTGTKLFLNIRPTTIHDPNFRADRLIRTLEECQLSPTDVVFEISEQESLASFGRFREMRDEYRKLGFEFALDDTGAGYSGLEELLELEPEYIKMDRSMVSGVDQDSARQEVLGALLQVAQKMGARVIGEGLDTLEELEKLGELGIHFGQGWLFGKPTPLRADT